MKFTNNLHTIADFKVSCQKKIPRFSFEYLESGTEKEDLIKKNLSQFQDISFIPKFCLGERNSSIVTSLFNYSYNAPFGIAPIGLAGLIRSNAEKYLVKTAVESNIPFCLSTVATTTPEEISDYMPGHIKNKWFQLYPPKDFKILKSLLERAKQSDFDTLVVTVDIPAPSRRERSRKSGLVMPFKLSTKLILDGLLHPEWGIETIVNGIPRLKTVENYIFSKKLKFSSEFVGNRLGGIVDWDYIKTIREMWVGPMIIKGILHENDAIMAKNLGCDGVYVSNHGARQFDGGVSPLRQLIKIRETVGPNFPLIYDGGITSGLDILKAIYCGANFVFVGRAFMYGIGSGKHQGSQQIFNILSDQLKNNMMQLGLKNIADIRNISKDQVYSKIS